MPLDLWCLLFSGILGSYRRSPLLSPTFSPKSGAYAYPFHAQAWVMTHTAGYFIFDIFVVLTHWKDFKEDACTLIHHGVGTLGRS